MGHMELDPQVHNKRVLENLGWAVGSTGAAGRVASDELYALACRVVEQHPACTPGWPAEGGCIW